MFSRSSSARAGSTPASSWSERSDPAVDDRRRRRLAEVVAHRAEHHRGQPRPIEVAVRVARLVDHHQRVHPDVALGMPLRLLRAADERLHLRQQLLDDAELAAPARSRSTAARRRAAASRSRPRCARPADRRAGCRGRAPRVSSSSVNSKRAANCSARSTRRLSSAKCRGSTTRRTRAVEVGAAVERIDVLAGQRIPGDRVDGEVAAPRRVLDDIDGSPSTAKPLCPRPVFDSRRGSATSMRARACRRRSSGRPPRRGRSAPSSAGSCVARACRTLRGPGPSTARPQQPIAHAAADDQRAAAGARAASAIAVASASGEVVGSAARPHADAAVGSRRRRSPTSQLACWHCPDRPRGDRRSMPSVTACCATSSPSTP